MRGSTGERRSSSSYLGPSQPVTRFHERQPVREGFSGFVEVALLLACGKRCLVGLDRALGRAPGPFAQAPHLARLQHDQKRQDREAEEGDDPEDRPDVLDQIHEWAGSLRTDAGASGRELHHARREAGLVA